MGLDLRFGSLLLREALLFYTVSSLKVSIAIWTVWYAYWIISARHRVRSTDAVPLKRESLVGRLGYMSLLVAGFGLLFWRGRALPVGQFWSPNTTSAAIGLTVQVAGLAFAIWARQILGSNWAARVTIGGNQQLVIRGPYRIVRHPIYSGLLLGALGTAIVEGQGSGFLGWLFVVAGVLIKLRREETALRQHFGGAYSEYAQRVPALLPLGRR